MSNAAEIIEGLVIDALATGEAPRVADKAEVNGLVVSTVDTAYMGYETALLDARSAHPVERYATEAEAVAGHQRWTEKAKSITTVTKLGWGGLVGDEEITLERKRVENV